MVEFQDARDEIVRMSKYEFSAIFSKNPAAVEQRTTWLFGEPFTCNSQKRELEAIIEKK